MVDPKLAESIWQKMEDETFGPEDFNDYLELFVKICNENQDVFEEIESWDNIIQLNIEGISNFSIMIKEGKVAFKLGQEMDPDVVIDLNSSQAIDIFMGLEDIKEMCQNDEIQISGTLKDAIKFRLLTEIVREELEEFQPNLF